jgi:hypothetical protein
MLKIDESREGSSNFAKPVRGDDRGEIKLAGEARTLFWRKPLGTVSAAGMKVAHFSGGNDCLARGPSV